MCWLDVWWAFGCSVERVSGVTRLTLYLWFTNMQVSCCATMPPKALAVHRDWDQLYETVTQKVAVRQKICLKHQALQEWKHTLTTTGTELFSASKLSGLNIQPVNKFVPAGLNPG